MRKKFNFVHSIGDVIKVKSYCETANWNVDYLRIVLKGLDSSDDYLFDNLKRLGCTIYIGNLMKSVGLYGYVGGYCYRKRRVGDSLYFEFIQQYFSAPSVVSGLLGGSSNSISGVSFTLEGFTEEGSRFLANKYKMKGEDECTHLRQSGWDVGEFGYSLVLTKMTGCDKTYQTEPLKVNPSDLGLVLNPSDRGYICTFELVKK